MNLFDVYPLFDVNIVKGKGCHVWDDKGTEYLDLYGGHAVISIGHSHPHYVKKVSDQLSELGFYSNSVINKLQQELVDRLLTSGQEATAEEGISLLADLQKKYGNQIEIIAGCGVNENNAEKIMKKTGIKQLHSTCRGWGVDATGMGERVSFQVSDEDGDRYRSVSVDRIKKFVEICG